MTFNWFTVGSFTGYDSTNESNGFSLQYFVDKWDFAINQIYLLGLFVIAPLGIAGLVLMYRGGWRRALIFTTWALPGMFLYMTYYWGQNVPGVWYLRFFLTLFPALIIAAMYLLRNTQPAVGRSILAPLAAGMLVAASAAVGLWGSLDDLVREHRGNMNLHYSAREILSHVKPSTGGPPMMIADQGMFPQLLQYMQFMCDADWYASDIFAVRAGGGFGLAGVLDRSKPGENTPTGLQPERLEYIDAIRKDKTDADFITDARHLMDQALSSNRRVYVILAPDAVEFFRHRFINTPFAMVEVNHWSEPCSVKFPEGERSPLMPTYIPDSPFLPWHPMRRMMFEITRAPTTQPASQPAGPMNVAHR